MAMTDGTARRVKTGKLNYGNYDAYVKLYVYYKITQNILKNQSTVSCGMYFTVTEGYHIGPWTDSGSYVGTTSNTFTKAVPYTGGTYWLVEDKTFTVNHKSDGTGSATIYWKWGVNSPWGQMVTPSSSFTIPLPTIGRTSSVSATNAYIGNTSTISISRQNDAFTHKLQYQVDGEKNWVNINNGNKVGTSYKWTIPSGIYGKLSPNSKTVDVTIKCTTYNGSTSVGSTTCTITVTGKNAELKPNTPTLNASVVDGYSGYYIKGKSKVKLTSKKPTTKYGATISEYIFTGPNTGGTSVTSDTKTSGIIQSYGNLTYGVQVKDSRGVLSDKGTVTINVKNYAAPTIKSINVTKTENNSNMTITAKVVTTHYAIGSNALTISMSEIGNISPSLSGPTKSGSTIITSAYTYTYSRVPLDTSGDITATVYDAISGSGKSVSKSTSITPATRMLNFASNGKTLAVGGFATPNSSTNLFECHWDTQINGNLYIKSKADTEPDTVYASGVPLIIGDKDSEYLALDSNEIMAKNTKENLNGLYLSGTEIFIGDGREDAKKNYIWFKIPEIQHGIVKITPTKADTPTSKIVTFSKTFSSDPDVIVTPLTAGPYTHVKGVGAYGASTTQFTACLTRKDLQETSLYWIAVN